jgi:hypothetical protein
MTSSTAIARPPAANLNFIRVRVFITPLAGIAILCAATQALANFLAGRCFRAHQG